MTSTQIIHNNFNTKQLKLPLSLEMKIPFDSEVRTFDEVFDKLEVKKYLVTETGSKGRIGYNPVNMLKLILFCQMEKIQSLRAMELQKMILESCGLRMNSCLLIKQLKHLWIDI